jgi:RES domain-containing protein
MLLWRVSNHADLTGLGGERLKGRWHTVTPGRRILYLSEHPAVALIESLVNLDGDPRFFPQHFQLLKIVAADGAHVLELSSAQISAIDEDDPASTQAIGDAWLTSRESALLRVPSIPSPESWNYLLNPLHPDASLVNLEWARHIAYDKRLFRLTDA